MKKAQESVYDKVDYLYFCCLISINNIYLYFSCNNLTKEDLLYRNMMDKEKDIVDKDVKVKTQAATSDNNDGSVYQGQEETTELTTFTDGGTCIELDKLR